MYQNNSTAIESMLALKILTLTKSDRKWLLKKLPKHHAKVLKDRISSLNLTGIDEALYNEIYNKLNLDFYFQKSEVDKKIDDLNKLHISTVSKYIDNQPDPSLKMMLLCREKVTWINQAIPKLKISKDELNELDDGNRNNKEKLTDSIIAYLHESLYSVECSN